MAGDREQRFQGVPYEFIEGAPVFDSATAVLIIKVRAVFEVESNAVVVCDAISGFEFGEQSPLLYHKRGFVKAGARLKENG
jgi:flavin reductase (DIM6/NTAB) family NADH-FMN oxidoreductase RutF